MTIPLLDTGKYYFVETSGPNGYAPIKGPIPSGLINVPNSGGDLDVSEALKPINEKTETPTIDKKIRSRVEGGQPVPEYAKDDLKTDIGQRWQYALDVPMPAPLDKSKDYTITDIIPDPIQIEDLRVQIGDGSTFSDNATLTSMLKQNFDYTKPNNLKLTIPSSRIDELGVEGKVIRIEIDVKFKTNVNLLESGYLKNGVVPNTAYLQFGDVKLESTVNVKPVILRNIQFNKSLGTTNLSGATFKLHTKNPDGSMSVAVAKDPFTGEELSSTSNDQGIVSFKNVPAGEYIMVESAPIGTFPIYDNIWVSVSDQDIPTSDENAVIFKTLGGATLDRHNVINNQLISISGTKNWDDEDNRYNNRPESITINLYRYAKEEGISTKQLVETRQVTAPWTYEFKDREIDGVMTHKYTKYDSKGNEYVYVVEEEPVPAYSRVNDGVKGYDIKNKIDQVPLSIVKKDTKGNLLNGRKFIIRNENGNEREHSTDSNGILTIPDLTKGE